VITHNEIVPPVDTIAVRKLNQIKGNSKKLLQATLLYESELRGEYLNQEQFAR
jgi:hypothetical protein